jgi:hypothetical protein
MDERFEDSERARLGRIDDGVSLRVPSASIEPSPLSR